MLSSSKENHGVGCKEKSKTFSLEEENLDFGKIMDKFGRFQYQSLLQICPSYAMVAVIIISHVFLNVTPDHICRSQLMTEVKKIVYCTQNIFILVQHCTYTGSSCRHLQIKRSSGLGISLLKQTSNFFNFCIKYCVHKYHLNEQRK